MTNYTDFAECDAHGHSFDLDFAAPLLAVCSRCGRAVPAEQVRTQLVALGLSVPPSIDAAVNEDRIAQGLTPFGVAVPPSKDSG